METLATLFNSLASRGRQPAVVAFDATGKTELDYSSLAERIDTLATTHSAFSPGTRIGVIAVPTLEAVVMALAVLRSGATLIPLDAQYGEETLRAVLDDAAPAAVWADPLHRDRFVGLLPEDALIDLDASPTVPHHDPFPTPAPSDTAVLFYTSGTTGAPKGVPLSHANLCYQLDSVRALELVHPGERLLLPLPFHHVYPFVIGLLVPLALNLCLVLPRALTGPQVLRAIREANVNVIVGVPRLYRALLEGITARVRGRAARSLFRAALTLSSELRRRTGRGPGRHLLAPLHRRIGSHLRLLTSGGAALDPELALSLEGLGWQVAIGYGLTETSPLLTVNLPRSPAPGSIGRALPGTELRVSDSELQARGPGVFAGYRNRPDDRPFTADGWFRTGDLARIDGEGWVYLSGRASTLIVTEGGENIQPEPLEAAYESHPAIAEIGIFAEAHRLRAVVMPSPAAARGEAPATTAVGEAIAAVGRTLPSYQRIGEFAVTRDPLERTRLGKLRRHRLSERFRAAQAGVDATERGPLPESRMDPIARTLLEDPAPRQVWSWLSERYSDRRLTPDSDLQLDLGVDSLGWLDLTAAISELTGLELSPDQLAQITTVRDLLQALDEAKPQEPGAAEGQRVEDERWLHYLGPVPFHIATGLYWVNRWLVRYSFPLEVETGPLPDPCIFTPNHLSYLDAFVLGAVLERKRLARTFWGAWPGAAFQNPFNREISRLAQAFPVEEQRPAHSLARAAAVLDRGDNLVWFPEGGRSVDGHLRPFRPGIGRLLDKRSVPVVPVLIRGTEKVLPPGRRLPHRGVIRIEMPEVLLPEELARRGSGTDRAERIADGLYRWMAERLESPPQ